MRAKAEECKFADFLLQIGNGEYPSVDSGNSESIDLPSSLIANSDIVSEIYIYGRNFSELGMEQFSKVAILAPKNEHCNEINQKVLDLIQEFQDPIQV